MRLNRRTFVVVALTFVGGLLLLWTVRHLASTGFIEIVEAEYGVPNRPDSISQYIFSRRYTCRS